MKTKYLFVVFGGALPFTALFPLAAAETAIGKNVTAMNINSLALLAPSKAVPTQAKADPLYFRFKLSASPELGLGTEFHFVDKPVFSVPKKEPNQAPEPTATAVTSPAAQEPRQP